MSGNEDLRRELDAASKLIFPASYDRRLADLRSRYDHTISTEPSLLPINQFNCFAFAFGLTDHSEYSALLDLAGTSAALNSKIVKAMFDAGDVTLVEATVAKEGDIALYFDGEHLAHAGRLTAPNRILSKWGGNEIHAHGLWEVPLGYGHSVKFIMRPDVDSLIQRLLREAKTSDA